MEQLNSKVNRIDTDTNTRVEVKTPVKPVRSKLKTSVSTQSSFEYISPGDFTCVTPLRVQPSMGVDIRIRKAEMAKKSVSKSEWESSYIAQAENMFKKDLTPFLDSLNFDLPCNSVVNSTFINRTFRKIPAQNKSNANISPITTKNQMKSRNICIY